MTPNFGWNKEVFTCCWTVRNIFKWTLLLLLVSTLFLNKLTLSFSVSRLEEREAELKKEYNALHSRHTEVSNEDYSLVVICAQGEICCCLGYQVPSHPGVLKVCCPLFNTLLLGVFEGEQDFILFLFFHFPR